MKTDHSKAVRRRKGDAAITPRGVSRFHKKLRRTHLGIDRLHNSVGQAETAIGKVRLQLSDLEATLREVREANMAKWQQTP